MLHHLDALSDAEVRAAYVDAVGWFTATVGAVPDGRWDDRATDEFTIRELVAHTARSLSLVQAYLDALPQRVSFVGRTGHTKALFARPVPTLRRDLRERAEDTLRDLGPDLAPAVRRLTARLLDRLATTADDAVATTPLGSIAMIDLLPSRIGEVMVHTLDLHRALGDGVGPAAPPLAVEVALAFVHALGNPVMAVLALTGRIGYDVLT